MPQTASRQDRPATENFDVARFAWNLGADEDLSDLYDCDRFPPNGQNDTRWCDRVTTAALQRAEQSIDFKSRQKDIDVAQRAIYDQVPTIVLYARRGLTAYSSDIKNWPQSSVPFDSIMDVDI